MNIKKISPQSATAQSGQNILHKVHPKIICHLPPCLIGSGLSWGIQCLFKLVWKTLNCVCWSRHKNHLYLLALQRYAAVLEFLICQNYNNQSINVKLRAHSSRPKLISCSKNNWTASLGLEFEIWRLKVIADLISWIFSRQNWRCGINWTLS